MAVIHEKRGGRKIPHYFHNLKEKDGSSKAVYLGSDPYTARKNIIRLDHARLDKQDALFNKSASLQHSLNKIAEHQRPLDHRLQEVKKAYYAQKHYDALLAKDRDPERGMVAVVIILGLTSLALLAVLFLSPEITGFSILDSGITMEEVITTPFAGTFLTALLIVLIGVTVLHAKFHMRRKRLEKFQS